MDVDVAERRAGLRIEVELIKVLREGRIAGAEDHVVAIVEREETAEHVFGGTAAEVDAVDRALHGIARPAIAGDVDVIAGAAHRIAGGRGGQRAEQQRPSGDARSRSIERGERDVSLDEAQPARVLKRALVIENAPDVEHRQIGVAGVVVGEPVLETGQRVDVEREGGRNVVGVVGFFRQVVHAVRGEQHGARVDQRAGAHETVGAEEHAHAAIFVIGVDDFGARLVLVGDNGGGRGGDRSDRQGGKGRARQEPAARG